MFGSTKRSVYQCARCRARAGRDGDFRSSKRASGVPTRRRLMPSSQGIGDWVRTHAIRVGLQPARCPRWVHDELARSSEPSRGDRVLHPRNAARRRHARTGWARRFTESHLASVPEDRAGCRHHVHPDPILRGSNPRGFANRDRGMFLPWCGSRLAEMPETRVSGSAELAAPRHPAGPQQAGCLSVRSQDARRHARIGEAGRCGEKAVCVESDRDEAYWLACGRYVSSIRSGAVGEAAGAYRGQFSSAGGAERVDLAGSRSVVLFPSARPLRPGSYDKSSGLVTA